MNIFRFDENGEIAEHWDVMETIADKSTWQNQNGKFKQNNIQHNLGGYHYEQEYIYNCKTRQRRK